MSGNGKAYGVANPHPLSQRRKEAQQNLVVSINGLKALMEAGQ